MSFYILLLTAFICFCSTPLSASENSTKDIKSVLQTEYTLKDLEGVWIRKESNNPTWDGVEIEVKGNNGISLDIVGSAVKVGDIKWSNIKKTGSNTFDYRELGSDRNYYDAILTFTSKNSLELRVIHHGAGNSQKWIRKGAEVVEPITGDLAKIQGKWKLTASNNSGYDGMQVEVEGDKARIINQKVTRIYKKGKIKWKGITQVDANEFAFSDVNDKGVSTFAVIRIADENTLKISLGSSVAGNKQTWKRVATSNADGIGSPVSTQGAKTLSCNISEDTVLTNGVSEVDYVVNCVVDITAKLTIEPGVMIVFEENAGLGVYDNGSLNVLGTNTKPVIMRSKKGSDSKWRGIHIETASNSINYLKLSDAGENYVYCCNEKASLFLKGGTVSISNSTINNGANIGILAKSNSTFTKFKNNIIKDHIAEPLAIEAKNLNEISDISSDLTGNTSDFILIRDSKFDADIIINKMNIPYLFEGEVYDVTAPLSIKSGVNMIFKQDGGLGIFDEGALKVEGTESDPVIFRGNNNVAGYWRGVHIETSSLKNSLEHLNILNAGSNYVYCCNEKASLFLKGDALLTKLNNVRISNGGGYGIFMHKGIRINQFLNVKFSNLKDYPIVAHPENLNLLKSSINVSQIPSDKNHISIKKGQINSTTIWYNQDIPYLIDNGAVVDVTAPLTIQQGTEIVFQENAGLGVYDNGSLKAIGSSDQKIEFKGKENIQGYWRGIHIETNSLNNVIEHSIIKNGGSNYVYCCNDKAGILLKGNNGRLSLKNSMVSDSGGCGVSVRDGTTFTESGNTFSNNAEGNICYGKPPSLPKSIATATTLENTPRDVDYIVPVGQVTDLTAALTIEPGVVIVFEENAGLGVYDNGTLKAIGSSDKKIEFRGKEDLQGYWRGIHIETNSLNNVIEHAIIKNGGSNYVYCCNEKANLFLKKNGRLSLKNSMVSDSGGCGVYVIDGSTFTESGNTFSNNVEGHICNQIPKDKPTELPCKISKAMTLVNTPAEVDYIINCIVDVKAKLTIEPGVVIEFGKNAGLNFNGEKIINPKGIVRRK